MGSEERAPLTVVYSATAQRQLDEIWEWNAGRYGVIHVDRYVDFLQRRIDALSVDHRRGKLVPDRPGWRYFLIRRHSRGHGHIAVFAVDDKQFSVLYIFHSAQDWENRLGRAMP